MLVTQPDAVELDMSYTSYFVRFVVVVVGTLSVVWSNYLFPLEHCFDCWKIVVEMLNIPKKIHFMRNRKKSTSDTVIWNIIRSHFVYEMLVVVIDVYFYVGGHMDKFKPLFFPEIGLCKPKVNRMDNGLSFISDNLFICQ